MGLKRFLKENKTIKENTTYAPTKSLTDEKGDPIKWIIKPLTTKENEVIRENCTREVQVTGKPGMFRPKMDTTKYVASMIVASVEYPNLNDRELQDSYGVMSPEDLLKGLVDNPGEYQEFAAFVQEYNGFTESLQDKVDEAKN